MSKKLIKYSKIVSFFLFTVVSLGACNGGKGNDDSGYKINLGYEELYLVKDTAQRLEFEFLPDIPLNMDVTWESSDPNVASVSSSGYVKALDYGTTTISVTMAEGGSKDSCVVTVGEPRDFVSNLKLDQNSTTKKAEVTTHLHIDGDTTHFYIDPSYGYGPGLETGILKARYLAVDTPESTGKIEPWGKKASAFTKNIVNNAKKIIVESEDAKWNVDSTGGRALVWVWYQMNEGDDFRNLNVELLQNGLSNAKNTLSTRYGEVATAALNQAKAMKLNVFSDDKDPDYYYGKYQATTLKDIRTHLDKYNNTSVSFDATIARVLGETVYLEDYDEEDGINYGMQLFLGYTQYSGLRSMIYPNYRIRVAGSLQYYEAGGTYQIADPAFDLYAKDDSLDTFRLIADADHNTEHACRYPSYSPSDLTSKVKMMITEEILDPELPEGEDGDYIEVTHEKEFTLGSLICSGSASFNNLTVTSTYTTSAGDSKGAISLTCKDPSNNTITVRTEVLKEDGKVVTADRFEHKVINAKGVIDYFDGKYQLKVLALEDIEIVS